MANFSGSLVTIYMRTPTRAGLAKAQEKVANIRTVDDFRRVFRQKLQEANLRVMEQVKEEMSSLLSNPLVKATGTSAENFVIETASGNEESATVFIGNKTKGNFFILFGWSGSANRQLPDRNRMRKWLQAKGVVLREEGSDFDRLPTTRYVTVRKSRRAKAHIRVLNKHVEDMVLWRIRRSIKFKGSYMRFRKLKGSNATGTRYNYAKIAMDKVIGKDGDKLITTVGELAEMAMPVLYKAFTMANVSSRRFNFK